MERYKVRALSSARLRLDARVLRQAEGLARAADLVLGAIAALGRVWPGRKPHAPPQRILLLRLERIGDLLMMLSAWGR